MFAAGKSGAVTTSKDPQFNLTSLLVHADGTNGANNNTFVDSSTNALSITRNGTPTQGTFSPFSQTGWSNYITSGNIITSTLSGTGLSPYTNNTWTIEFWVYTNSFPGANYYTLASKGTSANRDWAVFINTSGQISYYYSPSSGDYFVTATSALTKYTWQHVAIVSNAAAITIYLNGSSVGTGTQTQFNSSNPTYFNFGSFMDYGATFYPNDGYLSNFRYVQGTAVYTAPFTPPTAPLTAITNTKMLTCQSNRFLDNSTNAYTFTTTGSPSVQAFSPFAPSAAYGVSSVGGSIYLGTTSDWVNVSHNSVLNLSTSDFTFECWIYPTNPNAQTYYGIVGKRTADASYGYLLFGLNSSLGLILLASSNGSGWDIANSSGSTALKKNVWSHVALVRSGSGIKAYLNGNLEISVTSSAAIFDNTAAMSVGNWSETQSSYPWIGYISNFRFVRGTAVYTANFTPPAAPVTAIAATQLLINGTNAGIYDQTAKNDLITGSGAKISTAQSQFGGSSMLFNGTTDYLQLYSPYPSLVLGSSDFTVEGWFYFNTFGSNQDLFAFDTVITNGYSALRVQSNSTGLDLYMSTSGGGWAISSSTSGITLASGQWYHIAVVRSGTNVNLYINGTSRLTATGLSGALYTSSSTAYTIGCVYSGSSPAGFYNGYIDDFRITKGYARYTSTFTPPTKAFPDR